MTEKTSVLVDAHIFDHSYQGTATYILGLYSSLVKHDDIEITICGENIDRLKAHFTDERFRFKQLAPSSKYKRLLFEYPRIIKNGGYDFAHFQYIVPFFKTTRFITTLHDVLFLKFKDYFPWSYRVVKGMLFKWSAKRSDIVLTVSEYSKKEIVECFNLSPENVAVTPNAVTIYNSQDIDVKSKYGIRNYILYVSRFEPRKNHKGLLLAFLANRLYEVGYDLVLIGSKKESIEYEAFMALKANIPSNAAKHVFFLEDLTFSELQAFYRNTSCFVFPSFAEGFGIPPIEAAVNNCKVLCSNATAMQEFDFFKYRFNPYNQSEFNQQLNLILSDEFYPYAEIKRSICEKYNWQAIAEHYYSILMKNVQKS